MVAHADGTVTACLSSMKLTNQKVAAADLAEDIKCMLVSLAGQRMVARHVSPHLLLLMLYHSNEACIGRSLSGYHAMAKYDMQCMPFKISCMYSGNGLQLHSLM